MLVRRRRRAGLGQGGTSLIEGDARHRRARRESDVLDQSPSWGGRRRRHEVIAGQDADFALARCSCRPRGRDALAASVRSTLRRPPRRPHAGDRGRRDCRARDLEVLVAKHRPGDATLGEEEEPGSGAYQTPGADPRPDRRHAHYSRGIPVWFTLLGLEPTAGRGRRRLGPALGAAGGRGVGDGALANGDPIRVCIVDRERVVAFAAKQPCRSSHCSERLHPQALGRVGASSSRRAPSTPRSSTRLRPWDIAALLLPIVEEASGRPPRSTRPPLVGPGLVTTNGVLHDAVLQPSRAASA